MMQYEWIIRGESPSLQAISHAHQARNDAIVTAHASGRYSHQTTADYFGNAFTTVARIARSEKAVGMLSK